VLLTSDGHGTAEIMRATGKAKTVIWRWQERFGEEGVAGLWRDKTRPSCIPPLGPEVAERIVALTLAGPPPTAGHWTGAAEELASRVASQGSPTFGCKYSQQAEALSAEWVAKLSSTVDGRSSSW
jgi:hypothetical protein